MLRVLELSVSRSKGIPINHHDSHFETAGSWSADTELTIPCTCQSLCLFVTRTGIMVGVVVGGVERE